MDKADIYKIITNVKVGYQIFSALYCDEGGAVIRCTRNNVMVVICVAVIDQAVVRKLSPSVRKEYGVRAIVRYRDQMMALYSVRKKLPNRLFRQDSLEADDGKIYLFEEVDEEALVANSSGITAWDPGVKRGDPPPQTIPSDPRPPAPHKKLKRFAVVLIVGLAAALNVTGALLLPRFIKRIAVAQPDSPEAEAISLQPAPSDSLPAEEAEEEREAVAEAQAPEPEEARPLGIKVSHLPDKTVQYVGEETSTTGLRIALHFSDKSEETVTGGFTVEPRHLIEAGEQTVTVHYGEFTATYTVTVCDVIPVKIEIGSAPEKDTYYFNETVDTNGLALKATCNNGEIKTVTEGYAYSPRVLTEIGDDRQVTVSWEGLETSFTVRVYGAAKILADNDVRGKSESEARQLFEQYNLTITSEKEPADGAHTGKVLMAEATSGQSVTLFIGEQTDFLVKEKDDHIIVEGISRTTESLTIPERINGLPVTEIAADAFREEFGNGDTGIDSVTFPSGLVKIGANAFGYCRFLEKVEFPDTLTEIGDHAFEYCSALKEIDFKNVEKIGGYAFRFSGLQEIRIPSTCTSIGNSAFLNIISVRDVYLPASLETIGPGAFTGCNRAVFHPDEGSNAEDYLTRSGFMGGS